MSLYRTDSMQAEQLLYLLARGQLNSVQVSWVDQTLTDFKEPERFAELATKTFVAPMAHFHLSKSTAQHMQSDMMAKLKVQRLQTAKNYLLLKSEANSLSANVMEPAGVRHAFFKGTAFADQFYTQPSMRHARDIDVLIAKEDLPSVVERGLALGYRFNEEEAAMSPAELAYYLTVTDEISLQSPRGAHIEIHTQLDKSGVLFNTDRVLSQAEVCEGSNLRRRLPEWLHLIYLCLHHTRHRWSHLHWLADLDAALSSPSYNLARLKAEATRLRLWQCVEPCLILREASGRPATISSILRGNSEEASEVQDLVRASYTNLARKSGSLSGGSGVLKIPDLVFKWQMTPVLQFRYLKWVLRRVLTPRVEDYQSSLSGHRSPALLRMSRLARVVRRRVLGMPA